MIRTALFFVEAVKRSACMSLVTAIFSLAFLEILATVVYGVIRLGNSMAVDSREKASGKSYTAFFYFK